MSAPHQASTSTGHPAGGVTGAACKQNPHNGYLADSVAAEAAAHLEHNGHGVPMACGAPLALGAGLAPALLAECKGRLSSIDWFRALWQRGGAATGFAKWKTDSGDEVEVLVKVPVGPAEHFWTTELSRLNGQFVPQSGPSPSGSGNSTSHFPTPRVFASGLTLGGHDLAWLIMERLHGHTLTNGWRRESLEQLLRAAAMMQARAEAIKPVNARPTSLDWERLLAQAREVARKSIVPEAQQWNDIVKRAQKALPKIAAQWESRPIDTWCHGDLHPGNAMHRAEGDEECVLIDLALVHAGSWVEDAIYLERQFWARPDALFGVHPVSMLARYRRELGLQTNGDYGRLANLRRVLMAACAPVHVAGDGHPRYLHAALETLERLLPQVAK